MIVPGCLNAGVLAAGNGHLSLSIITPLNSSTIGNNSVSEAITGIVQSTAGNITALQYQIDGGPWNNFTYTPSEYVNYSGGNAGEIGVGSHVLTVKATDAALNTATVSASYTIAYSPPPTSYNWGPYDTYNGQNNYLTIVNSVRNSTVAYTQTIYDAHGSPVATDPMVVIGTTDAFGNFSYAGTAQWPAGGWTDSVQLYVGGQEMAGFSFANFGTGPSYSYGPQITPSGALTLSIANSWASSVVAQTVTYSPSGRVVGPTALGSTSATGNFSAATSLSWGTDTSASISVTLNGQGIGTFGISS